MQPFDAINEELNNRMEELEELSAKYYEYKNVTPSMIPFRDVQNDTERQMAKDTIKQPMMVTLIVALAFAGTAVLSFATGKTGLGIFIAVLAVIIGIFAVSTVKGTPQVAYGRAIYKHYRVNNFHKNRSRMYFATVIFDEPEKILCRDLQITGVDYERIVEGTPMMVVKKGTTYKAKMY